MARIRVPAHITEEVSHDFGLNVKVSPLINNRVEEYPSGNPHEPGMEAPPQPRGNYPYREVIPAGVIGSEEERDPSRPGVQYVDTVAQYDREQNDPHLHGPAEAMRSAKTPVKFYGYDGFQPRNAAIPRARQDESILGNLATMSADPLMGDENSRKMFLTRDDPRRKDLFGPNVAGVLHNDPFPSGDSALYRSHDENTPSEQERAQLSTRRGQAAAKMSGQAQKDFIAKQGEVESNNSSRVAYNKLSQESAEKGY